MTGWIAFVLAALTAVLVVFLTVRLRLFADAEAGGRTWFVVGGGLLFLALVWQGMKGLPGYDDWFLAGVYGWLTGLQFVLALAGAVFVAVGLALYSDTWQMRREAIETREQKQSLLMELQRDARRPYQLMELLELSVKEVVSHLPNTAGAVFLGNRSRRQFVLAASAGLTREELAKLEYYPLERSLVGHAVENGEPVVSGRFEFIDRDGNLSSSRFASCLVLPLISEMENIGAMILLNTDAEAFDRADINYLAPVAGWLGERIRVARSTREISTERGKLQALRTRHSDVWSRLTAASAALGSSDALKEFCRSMVGLAESGSVHLVGVVSGELRFLGDSEPLTDVSENYRTALVNALDRHKPLIINQEATSESGRSYVAISTLVYPVGEQKNPSALLLRREGGAMEVGEDDLKALATFARLARVGIERDQTIRQSLSRRKGFARVVDLLRMEPTPEGKTPLGVFAERLADILPDRSVTLVFERQTDGSLLLSHGFNYQTDDLENCHLLPGEGLIGEVVAGRRGQFVFGRRSVAKAVEGIEAQNREAILRMLGERGLSDFMAVCPILHMDRVMSVVVAMAYNVAESERGEWERLVTLATGLYSVRHTVTALQAELRRHEKERPADKHLAVVANEFNNHLSAIIGNAELAQQREELSGDVRQHIVSIVGEAEKAAAYLKEVIGAEEVTEEGTSRAVSLGDMISEYLSRCRISGHLHMIAGQAREVYRNFEASHRARIKSEKARQLFVGALEHFSEVASDNDVITVSTYERDEYVYLDIARHRRDFSPVGQVAGFGRYRVVDEQVAERSDRRFLQPLKESQSSYCLDTGQDAPAYLSFRFPVVTLEVVGPASVGDSGLHILAIDDQAVILDLISAMCRSMGHRVSTADSGAEGLKLARSEDFDLVLTDLAMPDMSGLEVARQIHAEHPGIPIILVTGWEGMVSEEDLASAGITKMLNKPFRIEQLTEIIKSVNVS
ncbi:response regulator [candidate division GN15 bacterium]|nr:response regulator [candidate division GN15 bacterium]